MTYSIHQKIVLKTAEYVITSIIHFRLVINSYAVMAMILMIVTRIRNTCVPPDCLRDSPHRAKTEFLRVLTTTTLKYFFVKTYSDDETYTYDGMLCAHPIQNVWKK